MSNLAVPTLKTHPRTKLEPMRHGFIKEVPALRSTDPEAFKNKKPPKPYRTFTGDGAAINFNTKLMNFMERSNHISGRTRKNAKTKSTDTERVNIFSARIRLPQLAVESRLSVRGEEAQSDSNSEIVDYTEDEFIEYCNMINPEMLSKYTQKIEETQAKIQDASEYYTQLNKGFNEISLVTGYELGQIPEEFVRYYKENIDIQEKLSELNLQMSSLNNETQLMQSSVNTLKKCGDMNYADKFEVVSQKQAELEYYKELKLSKMAQLYHTREQLQNLQQFITMFQEISNTITEDNCIQILTPIWAKIDQHIQYLRPTPKTNNFIDLCDILEQSVEWEEAETPLSIEEMRKRAMLKLEDLNC